MNRYKKVDSKQIQQTLELLQTFITQGYIKINDQFISLKQLLSTVYNNPGNTTQTTTDDIVVDIERKGKTYKITRNDVLETIKTIDFSKYRRTHYYAIVNGVEYPAYLLVSKTIEYKYDVKPDIRLMQAIIALQKLGFKIIYKRQKNNKFKENIQKSTSQDNSSTTIRIRGVPYSLTRDDIKRAIEQNIKLANRTKYVVTINTIKYPIQTLVSNALSLKYRKPLKVSLWQAILVLHKLGFDVKNYVEEIKAYRKKQ